MSNSYFLAAYFSATERFSEQFNLTKNDGVVNNNVNTPTKPMLSMLKLSGLFYVFSLPKLTIHVLSFTEVN